MRTDFYVYVMFRPNGIPCYVGKGRGDRCDRTAKRTPNKHLRRIFDAAGGNLPIVKVRENLDERQALDLEVAFIAALGRKTAGGPLVNLTDGGEGVSGQIMSAESRAKMRAAKVGKRLKPEHRAKIAAAGIGKHVGKKRSPETCARIRAAAAGHRPSAEHMAYLVTIHTGRKRSDETIERMRGAQQAIRDRMSASITAMWARRKAERIANASLYLYSEDNGHAVSATG